MLTGIFRSASEYLQEVGRRIAVARDLYRDRKMRNETEQDALSDLFFAACMALTIVDHTQPTHGPEQDLS
ncbi:MAG: hypothetical protein L6Q57_07895 [Alphaproteobacteria bacterium]|nr:hypothetical protein [Alphaproteobacteria bacterium]